MTIVDLFEGQVVSEMLSGVAKSVDSFGSCEASFALSLCNYLFEIWRGKATFMHRPKVENQSRLQIQEVVVVASQA